MNRRDKLLHGLDFQTRTGIEIGALAKPLVRKSEGAIFYVDYADAAFLKQRFKDNAQVDCDKIVEVDAVWGENTLSECIGRAGPFDYVLASHVVEHVPDLITWLRELESVLKPDGQVRLAVPDRRFTFDHFRRETHFPEVLAAHHLQSRKPTVQQVFDYVLDTVEVDAAQAWRGAVPPLQPKSAEMVASLQGLANDIVRNGAYHDVHCWVFTPASFAQLMERLALYGLIGFKCIEVHDTACNEMEFFVAMQRCPDADEIARSWRRMQQVAAQGARSLKARYLGAKLRGVAGRVWRQRKD